MRIKKYLCDDCALRAIEAGRRIYSGAFFTNCNNLDCYKKAYYHVILRKTEDPYIRIGNVRKI